MAKFTYNNSVSSATKISPFFTNYGFYPRFNSLLPALNSTPEKVKEFTSLFSDLKNFIHSEIRLAQEAYSKQANKNQRSTPNFTLGSQVWLLHHHIYTTRPSQKLNFKHLRPFKISQKISPYTYKLKLPPSIKIHLVFHISLLKPLAEDPLPNQVIPPPPPDRG
jgi:hypothetical protein